MVAVPSRGGLQAAGCSRRGMAAVDCGALRLVGSGLRGKVLTGARSSEGRNEIGTSDVQESR